MYSFMKYFQIVEIRVVYFFCGGRGVDFEDNLDFFGGEQW